MDQADKYLMELESTILREEGEETLERLYTEVHEAKDMCGNPNYLNWIYLSTIKLTKQGTTSHQAFKIIKFLKDEYDGYYCANKAARNKHDMLFKQAVQVVCETVNSEIQNVIKQL